YQSLLEDARHGRFDVVVAEALDRLSRDQEDVAGLFKRLRFAGVRLFTLAEGEISELHVGLKGNMNALFLQGLAMEVSPGHDGRWRRGTGELNNELYIGKLGWNRQSVIKDPATGKRQARPNPSDEWVTQDVPDLRIVDDQLWNEVKARQLRVRHTLTHDNVGIRSERVRRPVYLLSNLLKCGACGGGFSKVSLQHYGCSNARNRGTC